MTGLSDNWAANWKKLEAEDVKAKTRGTIVGRYIAHPYADGNAVYRVVAASGKNVWIEVVKDIGDDWVLPAWGERTKIAETKAKEFIARRDALADLFANKGD